MSCFSGCFTSLPGVRCDRFDSIKSDGNIVAADQFFLSHVDCDNRIGLDTLALFCKKKSYGTRINNKLYCSQITKQFVLKKFPLFPDNAIVSLTPNEAQTIHVYDSRDIYKLRTTTIPSHHCPGSVMFLFEKLDEEGEVIKRILYTGDFRLDNPLIPFTQSLRSLHNRNDPVIIDEMYLDTTYCSNQYKTFPSRQASEEKIRELCQKWIRKNGMFKDTRAKHVILFHLPPRYGYETIIQHVHRKSLNKWQVHVTPHSLSEHLCSAALLGCVNTDPGAAQWVHACTGSHDRRGSVNQPLLKTLPCQPGDFEVCQIKPSTMYFTQSKMAALESAGHDRLVSVSQGGSNYRVCYSNHASLTELEQFVRYFAPLQITPCAIPPNSSREEVRDILASFLSDEDSLVMSSSCPREEEAEVRSSSSLSSGSRKRKLSSCGSLNFSESNSFETEERQPKLLKLERGNTA